MDTIIYAPMRIANVLLPKTAIDTLHETRAFAPNYEAEGLFNRHIVEMTLISCAESEDTENADIMTSLLEIFDASQCEAIICTEIQVN